MEANVRHQIPPQNDREHKQIAKRRFLKDGTLVLCCEEFCQVEVTNVCYKYWKYHSTGIISKIAPATLQVEFAMQYTFFFLDSVIIFLKL